MEEQAEQTVSPNPILSLLRRLAGEEGKSDVATRKREEALRRCLTGDAAIWLFTCLAQGKGKVQREEQQGSAAARMGDGDSGLDPPVSVGSKGGEWGDGGIAPARRHVSGELAAGILHLATGAWYRHRR
jgi:hypothetical protein